MSPSRKEEIIRQFVDLEDFGEELFAVSAQAPSLSRKQKKVMLQKIVGKKQWNFPQFALVSTASAFAAFAFIFGYAQMTSAPHFLNTLRIAKPTVQEIPTPQQIQQVQQQLTQQQEKIDSLKQTGASEAEISKAVDALDTTVKKTEKNGYEITKTTTKDGKTYISVKPLYNWPLKHNSGSGSDGNSGGDSSNDSKDSSAKENNE